MADVSGIINAIEAAIYTNGAELITGDILQAVLETMVNGLNTLKEDALVSGTNIKTVDGNSVLGSGDLSLSDVKYTAQTLTDAQKAQARANIGAMQNYVDAGTQDLYVRVNTINAPFAISVKYSKGGDKFFNVVVNYDISGDAFYILEVHGLSGYVGYYLGEDENSTTWLHIYNSAGEGTVSFALLPMTTQALPTWTNTTPTDYSDDSAVTPFTIGVGGGVTPVTSWQNPPTDTDVPSEKLVYDSLGKKGVISQTQTWSGSASTGYTYTMGDLVYGVIPQANIDLFVAAGATFNSISGYFELNGLTDISYEEMKAIYAVSSGATFGLKDRTGIYAFVNTRTVLPLYGSGQAAFTYTMSNAFYKSGILNKEGVETLGIIVHSDTADKTFYISALTNTFYECHLLRTINGILNVYNIASAPTTPFKYCYSLESLNLYKIKTSYSFSDSPNLSLASVVYMVENAINTSAITITLHATAYARCQADTTEYSYGGNTYTGILALATAHNISIAQV